MTVAPVLRHRSPVPSPVPRAGMDAVVRLLSCSVRLKEVSPQVFQSLAAIYPNLERAGSPQAVAEAEARVFHPGSQQGADLRDVLGSIESHVDTAAFMDLGKYVMIHAGVVADGESGILFPGASGAGKSTLVAALCHSGLRYLSDEYAVLRPGSLTLHPYGKSICLKPAGWRLIDDEFTVEVEPVDVRRVDGQAVRFLAAPDPYPVTAAASVRAVIVPRRLPYVAPSLTPLAPADALGMLMQNSLNLPWHGARGLETLASVVESADCFELWYSDLHDAVDIVTNLRVETLCERHAGGGQK